MKSSQTDAKFSTFVPPFDSSPFLVPMPSLLFVKGALQRAKSQLLAACHQIDTLSSLLLEDFPQSDSDLPLSLSTPLPSSSSSATSLQFTLSEEREKEWRERIDEVFKSLRQTTESLTPITYHVSSHVTHTPSSLSPSSPTPSQKAYTLQDLAYIVMVQKCVRSWLSRRMKRKILIEKELIETESKYVRDLSVLLSHYLAPLRAQSLLMKEQEDAIFGLPYLNEIHSYHTLFLTLLQRSFSNDICLGLLG